MGTFGVKRRVRKPHISYMDPYEINLFLLEAMPWAEAHDIDWDAPPMTTLDDDHRIVLEMYVKSGRSQRDVARVLGMSQGAICQRVASSIARLRTFLSQPVVSGEDWLKVRRGLGPKPALGCEMYGLTLSQSCTGRILCCNQSSIRHSLTKYLRKYAADQGALGQWATWLDEAYRKTNCELDPAWLPRMGADLVAQVEAIRGEPLPVAPVVPFRIKPGYWRAKNKPTK